MCLLLTRLTIGHNLSHVLSTFILIKVENLSEERLSNVLNSTFRDSKMSKSIYYFLVLLDQIVFIILRAMHKHRHSEVNNCLKLSSRTH